MKCTYWGGVKCCSIVIYSICIIAVNVFVLISGFFQIKLKLSGLYKFVFVVFFFRLVHVFWEYILLDIQIFRLSTIKNLCYFYSSNTAWFVKQYLLLMLCAPLLNLVLEKSTSQNLIYIGLVLTFINVYLGFIHKWPINENGYTLSHLIYMYTWGYMIKRFRLSEKMSKLSWATGNILCTVILTFVAAVMLKYRLGSDILHLFGYNNPIVIFSAICLFCLFLRFKINSSVINKIATGTFGIYLIHQYRPIWRDFCCMQIQQAYNSGSFLQFITFLVSFVAIVFTLGTSLCYLANALASKINTVIEKTTINNTINSILSLK